MVNVGTRYSKYSIPEEIKVITVDGSFRIPANSPVEVALVYLPLFTRG